jgi:hypothetical protein
MSIAEAINAAFTSAAVTLPPVDFHERRDRRGVRAQPPTFRRTGLNPGAAQLTPSAAVTSGFWRTCPPVEEKLPGVIAVPLAL